MCVSSCSNGRVGMLVMLKCLYSPQCNGVRREWEGGNSNGDKWRERMREGGSGREGGREHLLVQKKLYGD